jgi:hypothetical protein
MRDSPGAIVRLASAALALTQLAACGIFKSPAEELTFRAPQEWRTFPAFNGTQVWSHSSQFLTLMRFPARVRDLDRLAGGSPNGQASWEVHTIVRRDMTLCETQPSLYLETLRVSRLNGRRVHFYEVLSNSPDATYLAMYSRPEDTPSNQVAQAAIRELCPASVQTAP